jgi:hypothetical protein
MKKILLITTIILTLGFFIPNPALAVPCTGVSCSPGVSEDLIIQAIAIDEDGVKIDGADVTYVWVIQNPAIGILTSSNGVTCGNPTTEIDISKIICTETTRTTDAISTVNLRTAPIAADGEIWVTAKYGEITTPPKKINISTACKRLPALYYGIASVRVSSGVSSWQSSTAEVLETCRDEYKLYEGTGQGN